MSVTFSNWLRARSPVRLVSTVPGELGPRRHASASAVEYTVFWGPGLQVGSACKVFSFVKLLMRTCCKAETYTNRLGATLQIAYLELRVAMSVT